MLFHNIDYKDLGGTEILYPLRDVLASPQIPEYNRQVKCCTHSSELSLMTGVRADGRRSQQYV